MYAGNAGVVLGLGKIHAKYIGFYSFHGSFRFAWSLTYIGLLCVTAYGVGLPDVPRNAYQAMWSAAAATVAAAIGISLVELTIGTALLPRFVIFSAAVFLVPFDALCGFVSARDRRLQVGRDRVIAVVDSDEVAALTAELVRSPERRASLVWAVTAEAARNTPEGHRPLVETALEAGATVVVLDRSAQNDETVVSQAAELHEHGARIRTLSLFYDEWLGKLPLSELERVSLMFDIGELHRIRYGRVKRLLDIALVSLTAPVVVLVVALLALVVALEGGNPFYFQQRVGRGGRIFRMWKLRSMVVDADARFEDYLTANPEARREWDVNQKLAHDPRITKVGRILRKTSLDELPQLWNVLLGDMSLVGPRPMMPSQQALYPGQAYYRLLPGITGPWQVSKRNQSTFADRANYDQDYENTLSFATDINLLFKTVRVVLHGTGC